jgi:hypothetical protein
LKIEQEALRDYHSRLSTDDEYEGGDDIAEEFRSTTKAKKEYSKKELSFCEKIFGKGGFGGMDQ